MLNVELVVVGNVDRVGSIYSVNVRLVDVLTGKIIKNEIDDCPQCTLDQVFLNTLKAAAYKIAGLQAPPKPAEETPRVVQQPPSEPFYQPVVQPAPKPRDHFKMGFYVGLGSSNSLDAQTKDYAIKHTGSLEAGLTYDIRLSRTLFLKPEIVYQNRKAELTASYFYNDNYKDILHYLHFPVLLSWHFTSRSQFFMGPSFGTLMKGSYGVSGTDEEDYEDGQIEKRLTSMIFGTEADLGPLRIGYRFTKDLGLERENMKVKRSIQYLTIGLMIGR